MPVLSVSREFEGVKIQSKRPDFFEKQGACRLFAGLYLRCGAGVLWRRGGDRCLLWFTEDFGEVVFVEPLQEFPEAGDEEGTEDGVDGHAEDDGGA